MKNSQESSDGSSVFTLRCYSFYALGWILLAAAAQAQPVLHLRGWDSSRKAVQGFRRTRKPGRSHFLVQFAAQPGAVQLSALAGRGANALSYVPDFTLSISMRDGTDLSGLGIRWMGQLQPSEKISPLLAGELTSGPAPPVIVEFYSDVLEGDARAIAAETGASILDNPDLLPHHLLIEGTVDQVRQLAVWDEVSYIFPASTDLVQGVPVYGCAGALTPAGPVAQAVPLVGAWPGQGSASVVSNKELDIQTKLLHNQSCPAQHACWWCLKIRGSRSSSGWRRWEHRNKWPFAAASSWRLAAVSPKPLLRLR